MHCSSIKNMNFLAGLDFNKKKILAKYILPHVICLPFLLSSFPFLYFFLSGCLSSISLACVAAVAILILKKILSVSSCRQLKKPVCPFAEVCTFSQTPADLIMKNITIRIVT